MKFQHWLNQWNDFKKNLPHQKEPFLKRNWGNQLHSLCSFPGKLKPSIAHYLVRIFVPDRGSVLDMFAGVGTIPFEASLNEKRSFAIEISPNGYIVSKAKMQVSDGITNYEPVLRKLTNFIGQNITTKDEIETVKEFGLNSEITNYYHEETMDEIILARRFFLEKGIRQLNPSELLVMASLLHILHGNRPYALSRRSHPLTPYAPTGDFEYKPLIKLLKQKVIRSANAVKEKRLVKGECYLQDSTIRWPKSIDNLDAIVSSPPFYKSTRFYAQNWLRLWFAGWEPNEFKLKSSEFIDQKQINNFSIYDPILQQASERLNRNGIMVLHLGKTDKVNMAEEIANRARPWFDNFDIFEETVEHVEKHGITDKGTTIAHQYLLLF